ncbi:MAG TPA: hypothetical protein PK894_00010 [Defluviitoga sp.]|nr:hypothetical protein [Defluviitoga sp.]HOP24325.1 hypothetical protein [Defluviitoga sp.]HPZ28083.1 hypothetical protein [Defluviitoga sp.]HQD61973.1 hypothetical protein [Defluviitoga sp.]
MQLLKSTIIGLLFILTINLSLCWGQVSHNVEVGIYLTIPEFIKITNISKEKLYFEIEMTDNDLIFEDNLFFDVYANVDYSLLLEFKTIDDLNENVKKLVQDTYDSYITDLTNQLIVDAKENRIAERNKGIERYKLIFEMDMTKSVESRYPQFEGQVGSIEVIVSKLETI